MALALLLTSLTRSLARSHAVSTTTTTTVGFLHTILAEYDTSPLVQTGTELCSYLSSSFRFLALQWDNYSEKDALEAVRELLLSPLVSASVTRRMCSHRSFSNF